MTWSKASPELLMRFWKKVPSQPEDPKICWPWGGGRNSDNYGYFRVGPRIVRAHVFSLEQLLERSLLEGKMADHLCHSDECKAPARECPHRLCVRPSHLAEVTAKENVARRNHPQRLKRYNIATIPSNNFNNSAAELSTVSGPPPPPKLSPNHTLDSLTERTMKLGQWERDTTEYAIKKWKERRASYDEGQGPTA